MSRAEEETEVPPLGKKLLSDFQKDKFTHFFYHVLDLNRDHVISQVDSPPLPPLLNFLNQILPQEDFDGLNARVRHYMQWNANNPHYLTLSEVHKLFIDYFLQTATKFVTKEEGFDFGDPFSEVTESPAEKESVSIEEWVEVWGETVGRARKLADLPMWLQYYPKTLFDTINRSGTGVITKKELKLFYTAFIDAGKLGDEALTALTEKSYNAMTSNGDAELTLHMYKLSFLNFLLGKHPNGPGQFMFGRVRSKTEKSALFPIDYRALNSEPGERETFSTTHLNPQNSKRKSVIV